MDISRLLAPSSLAIIGASRNPMKIGNIVINNLLQAGYEGDIFPINPQAEKIHDLHVYTHIKELPKIPDLCIISIPTKGVLQAVKETIDFGCKQIIIYTAGFKEIGEEGAIIEQQLQDMAKKAGVTLLLPNCLGCIHTPSKLNASFAEVDMQPGNLKIISQSGAIASALFDRAQGVHIGFQTCVTLGNKTILNEYHFLQYRNKQQSRTENNIQESQPIGLYLEEISNGKEFMEVTTELGKTTPIILLKPGKSSAAQQAMQSHTGSIAGEDKVLQAACDQANIIRVDDIESFFNTLMYCSRQPIPKGNRVAIITNAGGPGVITTDLIEAQGLDIAEIAEDTKQVLLEQLPKAASLADPIDILGDAQAERYQVAITAIIEDQADVDVILVILTPQIMTEIEKTAEIIATISKQHDIPIVCSFVGQQHVHKGKEILRKNNIPCYDFPRQAVEVIGKAWRWQDRRKLFLTYPKTTKISPTGSIAHEASTLQMTHDNERLSNKSTGLLSADLTNELLDTYSIPTPQSLIISSAAEGQAFAEAFNYPVVLKLIGPELLHKIDVGGIITDITNNKDLTAQFDRMILAKTMLEDQGKEVHIQIQQQITDGIECILGIKSDPNFGLVLMFGPGGTLTELFHEHQVAILPTCRTYLKKIIEESSIYPLLSGYRGKESIDIELLLDVIESFITLISSKQR